MVAVLERQSINATLDPLANGDVLVEASVRSAREAEVEITLHLPLPRAYVWQHLSDYTRWSEFFPNLLCSRVVESHPEAWRGKLLHQVAGLPFLDLGPKVDIYLRAFEIEHKSIRFKLIRGSFTNFAAELRLDDREQGTLLTYRVEAQLAFPVPPFLIRQGIQGAFLSNLKHMRRMLCEAVQG
jgi:carbon monoxide dehydrogenase subunit G